MLWSPLASPPSDEPSTLAALAKKKRQRQKQSQRARQEYLRAMQRRARRRRQALAGVALIAVVAMVSSIFLFSGVGPSERDEGREKAKSEPASAEEPCPPADGSAPPKVSFTGPPARCIDPAKQYVAAVETDVGAFTVGLDTQAAPETVNNFVFLARYHFYDGSPFHRVIPGFVVQGGDGTRGDGTGDPGYKIKDELPKAGPYQVGSVAMANSGQPDSGAAQFFIVTGPEGSKLPPQYSRFGNVTAGLDVVQRIEADGSPEGTPKVVHKIVKVTVTESP